MKFDDHFYFQENIASLRNLNNCQMEGTDKYPVIVAGRIDALEIDHDLSCLSLEPLDEITLKVIVTRLRNYSFIVKDTPYYMQFLFYDFDKTILLFLSNAKVVKINNISTIGPERRCMLVIKSIKSTMAAYRISETKHGPI